MALTRSDAMGFWPLLSAPAELGRPKDCFVPNTIRTFETLVRGHRPARSLQHCPLPSGLFLARLPDLAQGWATCVGLDGLSTRRTAPGGACCALRGPPTPLALLCLDSRQDRRCFYRGEGKNLAQNPSRITSVDC